MALEPGGLLLWLIAGAIAGWLVGQVMYGKGFGMLGDIVDDLVGSFVGGWLFSYLSPNSSVGDDARPSHPFDHEPTDRREVSGGRSDRKTPG